MTFEVLGRDIIQFNFNNNVTSELSFSSIKGVNIFRVIQEGINNSIKYANATEISVNITESDSKINIEVADNGSGFDINSTELGNGLENMQKRIDEINGEISIHSENNKGTIIKITCDKNRTNVV